MELVAFIVAGLGVVMWLWLSFLATFAVRHDQTLDSFQKKAQAIIVWLVKKLIFGRPIPPNRNTSDEERVGISGAPDDHPGFGSDGGGNGGGGAE